MTEIFVAPSDEIHEGQRQLVTHNDRQICVMRVQGQLRAYLNVCPHQGGPVCDGLLIHKVEEVIDERRCYRGMRFNPDTLHVVCPWHGWEFNAITGANAGDESVTLKQFEVTERDGNVYVVL
ncbi:MULTISPECIES: Rieske (2Fe-2S) protein [Burkholderia cepacia complex]|uniref:Rieske (2Fe-2S) protein n=1 Tax=Burkholderia cepacia complex TaxID=87882 RepID=UPI0009B418A8|nr:MULTISPECIES: Rieske 2Fe-2S domain-containing protein [Burkholderia cepacia complex]